MASVAFSSSAMKRVIADWNELKNNPIHNVSAAPLGDDMTTWHCNIAGPEGTPYAGVCIHFVMVIPSDYPVMAPSAYFVTPIAYYGGATVRDSQGRMSVCLDLFGNFAKVHTEWGKDNQASGWTSSYTLSSILITMQAALMGNYLATDAKSISQTSAMHTCKDCGHSNKNLSTYVPPFPTVFKTPSAATTTEQVNQVNDIMCYMTKKFFEKNGVKQSFGFGVKIDPKNGSASTQCEYLSKEAFASGCRASTTNQAFSQFMPVFITKEHWVENKAAFMTMVEAASNKQTTGKMSSEQKAFSILASMMNNMVVEVMNQGNKLSANDRFINGYFNCYRLIKCLVLEFPALVTYVDEQIKRFLANSNNRSKKQGCPNLGDWLILLTISSKYTWKDVANEFIEECDARNVMWYVQKHSELADKTYTKDRNTKVFTAAETSRNLVCFQTRFLEQVLTLDLTKFDAEYGIVSKEVKAQLKGIYNEIVKIKNWSEYFAWNKMPIPSDDERLNQLIKALDLSEKKGYHNNKTSQQSYGGGRGGRRY